MAEFVIVLVLFGLTFGLGRYFLVNDHGAKEPMRAIITAFIIGVAAAIVGALLEGWLVPELLNFNSGSFYSLLKVGFIEEGVKFLPLAWLIYKKPYFNEVTDGVIYFGICGMGFGLLENLAYTHSSGFDVGIARIILVPFFHAATSGITGYYLAKAKVSHASLLKVFGVFLIFVFLHAAYDFGLSSGSDFYALISVFTTLTINGALIIYYRQASLLDLRLGLSSDGHNAYCRHCGKSNPDHNLYCTYCGNQA